MIPQMQAIRTVCVTATLLLPLAPTFGAQTPKAVAMDGLLGHLVGHWTMTGTVRGQPVSYTLDARRVLHGRFVELHMQDVHHPPAYEARVFIGVDSARVRYIAHWLDNFGAAYSIPPATGEMQGDTVILHFAYPERPFRDAFTYDRRGDRWYFRLEAADTGGTWQLFAEYQVVRSGS